METNMGMRISSGGAAPAASQSSVAQWQQQQVKTLTQAATPVSAPSKPTATLGNNLNVVA